MLKLRQSGKYRQLEDGGIAAKSEGGRPPHATASTAQPATAGPTCTIPDGGADVASRYSIPAAPASRTSLPQSSTSFTTNVASSSGEVGAPGIRPISLTSLFWPSDLRCNAISTCSRSMIGRGVPAGAISICQGAVRQIASLRLDRAQACRQQKRSSKRDYR